MNHKTAGVKKIIKMDHVMRSGIPNKSVSRLKKDTIGHEPSKTTTTIKNKLNQPLPVLGVFMVAFKRIPPYKGT